LIELVFGQFEGERQEAFAASWTGTVDQYGKRSYEHGDARR
jgi:hypothetical protein